MSTISIAAIALASGLLLSTAHVGRAHANDQDQKACSNKTLKGSYGFYRSGTTPTGSLAAVGIVIYDGNGNSSSIQTMSRNGVLTFDVEGSGEYEVAEDCTGKGSRDGIEGTRFVVVDGGNEIYVLSEMAGNTIYLVGKKIHTHHNNDNR